MAEPGLKYLSYDPLIGAYKRHVYELMRGAYKRHVYELMRCHFSRKFPTFNGHTKFVYGNNLFVVFYCLFVFSPNQTVGCTDLPKWQHRRRLNFSFSLAFLYLLVSSISFNLNLTLNIE